MLSKKNAIMSKEDLYIDDDKLDERNKIVTGAQCDVVCIAVHQEAERFFLESSKKNSQQTNFCPVLNAKSLTRVVH
eukprot:836565-Ditylum_brightwellii.AAC.1